MSLRITPHVVSLLLAAGMVACDQAEQTQLDVEIRKVTYVDDVSPILQTHCIACHVPGQQGAEASGLLLDSYESIMAGSGFGPVVEPGSAMTSSLYILMSGKERLTVSMPHGKDTLGAEEIETIRLWIDGGALEN